MNGWDALAKGENEELLCCFQTAISYYQKSVEKNNYEAMAHLAHIYEEGLGVRRDLVEAGKWWLRAKDGCLANAFLKAGDIYSAGTRTNQDITLAKDFYKNAIKFKNDKYTSCNKEDYILAEAAECLMKVCSESDIGRKHIQNSIGDLIMEAISLNPDNFALRKILMKSAPNGYITVEIIKKAADMGSVWAMYKLGGLYLAGDRDWGIEKDVHKGFELIMQSAMNANTLAMLQVSDCYASGAGTTQDYDEAAMWAGQAAKFGGPNICNLPDSLSYLNMNNMVHIHLSAKYAVKEAVQWHIKKAETGEIDAMLVLASIYERGDIVPKDSEKALYWHELAAKFSTEDNIKNDYYLGKYLTPWPDRKSRSWSYYTTRDVIFAGHGRVAYNLAQKLEKGNGLPQDTDRAEEWYARVAQVGNLDALHRLTRLCQEEIEEPFYITKWRATVRKLPRTKVLLRYAEQYYPTFTKEAFFWLFQAAIDSDHGDPDAMLAAAYLLSKGDGISKNAQLAEMLYKKAVRWNKREADHGNAGAMYNLAVMYRDGDGLKQNAAEAEKWFKKAAMKELGAGQLMLLGDIFGQDKGNSLKEMKTSLYVYAAVSGRQSTDKVLFYSPDWNIQGYLDTLLLDAVSKEDTTLGEGRTKTKVFISKKEIKINQSLVMLEEKSASINQRRFSIRNKTYKFFFIVTYLDCENEMRRVQLLTEAAQEADTPTCVIMVKHGCRSKRQEEFIRYISHRANSFIEVANDDSMLQDKKVNKVEKVIQAMMTCILPKSYSHANVEMLRHFMRDGGEKAISIAYIPKDSLGEKEIDKLIEITDHQLSSKGCDIRKTDSIMMSMFSKTEDWDSYEVGKICEVISKTIKADAYLCANKVADESLMDLMDDGICVMAIASKT